MYHKPFADAGKERETVTGVRETVPRICMLDDGVEPPTPRM